MTFWETVLVLLGYDIARELPDLPRDADDRRFVAILLVVACLVGGFTWLAVR